MTLLEFVFLFAAAVAAGAQNAIAGGGSFYTFPSLVFVGVPEITANATNTIALWPGVLAGISAYRDQLPKLRKKLLAYGPVSLIAGGLGAILLLKTPESTFEKLIPFLLLLATLIFASSARINRYLRSRKITALENNLWISLLLQFVIGVYGGYFGGGIGIMMLALLSVSGMDDLNEANALKLVLNSLINGVAVVIFIAAGAVLWSAAVVMIVGAIIGGYGGAILARRVDQKYMRMFIVAVGLFLTVYFFIKYF